MITLIIIDYFTLEGLWHWNSSLLQRIISIGLIVNGVVVGPLVNVVDGVVGDIGVGSGDNVPQGTWKSKSPDEISGHLKFFTLKTWIFTWNTPHRVHEKI